jgi:hypothetical protein
MQGNGEQGNGEQGNGEQGNGEQGGDNNEVNPNDPAGPLPDLENMTIAALKVFARDREYSDVWRKGTKKADYISWIRDEHVRACHAKKPDPFNHLLDNMRIATKLHKEKLDEIRTKKADLTEIRDATIAKIAEIYSKEEKTAEQYEKIISLYILLVKINEGIAACGRLV